MVLFARSVVALVLLTAYPASAQPIETLTLESAIALAYQGNRELKGAALENQKADDRIQAARTYRLPQFSSYVLGAQLLTSLKFHFDPGVFGTYPGIGAVPGFPVDIQSGRRPAALVIGQVNQPLTQQFRIGLGLAQLRLARQLTTEQAREKRQSVLFEVRRAYYGILQAQTAMESALETVKVLQEIDRLTADYVAQQAALPADALEVKARLAKSKYDASILEGPLANARERLNGLLGRPLETGFRVSPLPAAPEDFDLAAARRIALENRPEIRQAELRARQAETDRRMKKAEYIPDVSANFTYFSPVASNSILPTNVTAVGLLLNWTPFDWGRKKHEIAEKSKTKEQADLAVAEARSLVALDVGVKFRAADQARLLLGVVEAAQAAAREQLRVAQHKYSEQAALLKDVLQAQAAVSETNSQYQQAVLGVWNARAELEKAMGND